MAGSASAVFTNRIKSSVSKGLLSQGSVCPCHQQVPPVLLCLGWLSCPTLGAQSQGSAQPSSPCPDPAVPLARAAGMLSPPSPEGLSQGADGVSPCCPGPRSRPRQQQGAQTAASSPCPHPTARGRQSTPRAPRTRCCSARESPWTRGTAREWALGAAGEGGWPHTWPGRLLSLLPRAVSHPRGCICHSCGVHLLLGQQEVGGAGYPRSSQPDPEGHTGGRGSSGSTLCSGRCRGFQWSFALQDGVQVPRKQHSASSFLQQADREQLCHGEVQEAGDHQEAQHDQQKRDGVQ